MDGFGRFSVLRVLDFQIEMFEAKKAALQCVEHYDYDARWGDDSWTSCAWTR